MIDRVVRIAIVCCSVMLSTSAQAQLKPQMQTGSLIAVDPKVVEGLRASEIRKAFAKCVFQRSNARVLAMLEHSDLKSIDFAAAGIRNPSHDLDMDDCLGEEVADNENELGMAFSSVILRDLMAEEAYLAANRTLPNTSTPLAPMHLTFVSTGPDLTLARSLAAFADCTITRNIVQSDVLLRTAPGTPEERSAAALLAPALGACLTAGQQVSLKPRSIRSYVAYAMWNRFARGVVR